MKKSGPITGTFIDEITFDIPSSNWTAEQWEKDLDYMQEIGIDTVIFIRGGFEDKSIFPSKVLNTEYERDLAKIIFEGTSKRNMDVYFGMYISNLNWNNGDAANEIRINKRFVDEVYARYGSYPSFKGWYIPQEDSCERWNLGEIMRGMSAICKDKTPDKNVLISPFFKTAITSSREPGFAPAQHCEEWEKLFAYGGKDIDICAFQDGTAPIDQMEEFYTLTAKLCEKYDIHHWVNAETFERDVRKMFYPINFSLLKRRLELHQKYAEKIITFEFSHFLSPQSIYPSAHNLNRLYKDYYLK